MSELADSKRLYKAAWSLEILHCSRSIAKYIIRVELEPTGSAQLPLMGYG